MEIKQNRYFTLARGISLLVSLILASCRTSNDAPVPASNRADSLQKSGINDKNSWDEDKSENELEESTDVESDLPQNSPLKKIAPSKSSIGGADVGDSAIQTAVRLCNAEGYFYNRYKGPKGECTRVQLAQISCTQKDLSKLLTSEQKTEFTQELDSSIGEWLIDQCIDCSSSANSTFCKSKDGKSLSGLKVFLALDDSDDIRGKTILLPLKIMP